jgi:sporulation protein YlmC with PRC-barrel domain
VLGGLSIVRDVIDEGHAIHYSAVERGTPVYSFDGVEIGKVDEVVDNFREHILDGFVIEDADGKLRFADAPEVARTSERAVTLAISAAEASQLPPPEKAAPSYRANPGAGRLGRLFGRGWRRR